MGFATGAGSLFATESGTESGRLATDLRPRTDLFEDCSTLHSTQARDECL